ncbi:MAG TPA: dienelactone hydrolase family protein [Acidimicrobiia bacterium]|nr:dienelactone hydrolase family protein [Acidimicrobiia bacterium]
MGTWETIEADGAPTRQYVAGMVTPGALGVVLFHAWWGLDADMTAYADRLGAAGFAVAAPDLVAGKLATTVDEAEELSGGADEALADAVALAAIDGLASRLGLDSPIATVGFSFGAAWSIWSAAERDRIAASVVYYGTISGGSLARASVPVLGHFAANDPFETDEGVADFEAALVAAGRAVTIHRYPGTGHWFAEPSREAYVPEAADLAFSRTVDFLQAHLSR